MQATERILTIERIKQPVSIPVYTKRSGLCRSMSRVLHMMNGIEVGGRERVVLDLITKARRERLDHRLLLFDSAFRNEQIDFAPADIPVYFEKREPGFDWTFPARLARRLEEGDYDALHAHNDTAIVYGSLATMYPGKARAVLIGTFHTLPSHTTGLGKAFTNLAGREAAYLTVVSPELGRRLTAEGWVSRCSTIIWNGVDLDEFTPDGPLAGWRQTLNVRPSSVLVGHIGRFSPVKRHFDLLAACRIANAAGTKVECALVGQGDMLETVQKAAADCQHVRFIPRILDVAGFLRELDIFVICSEHEGAPRVLLEAMACRCAIVATAVGGMPEMLTETDGTLCGCLVPPNRPEELARAITELASSVELRRTLGSAARRRAAAFSADRQWSEYARLYCSLT